MNQRMSIGGSMILVALLAMNLQAAPTGRTLYWTGSSSDKWNLTAENFVVKDAQPPTPVAFVNGDDVIVDDDHAVIKTIFLNYLQLNPNTVVVDTASTVIFTNMNYSAECFGWDVQSFTKKGTGKLVFTDCHTSGGNRIAVTIGPGGLQVLEGEVEYQKRLLLADCATKVASTISVADGATLRFSKAAMFGFAGNITTPVTIGISIDKGGTFILSDPVNQVATLGPLTFNDGDAFDYSEFKGYSEVTKPKYFGALIFTDKVTLNGTDTSYEWTLDKSDYPDNMKINIWDGMEFEVADTTGDDGVDFTLGLQVCDRVLTNNAVTLPSGFIKSGAGTMALTNATSKFTGDIDIRGGILQVGPNGPYNASSNHTYIGSYVDGRSVTVRSGASLYLPNRNCFGTQSGITNFGVGMTFVFDGGALTNQAGQGFLLPDLVFKNGGKIAPGTGADAYGRFMCKEHFKVLGTVPFEWNLSAETTAAASGEALSLNGYPRNIFTIEDVTGDSDVDATFGVPFIIANGFFRKDVATGSNVLSDCAFGFTKRGAGTMRYTAAAYSQKNNNNPGGYSFSPYNGNTDVEEGTLLMDGDIAFSDTVNVSNGAFFGGSGIVSNVSFAAGAGFKVRTAAPGHLTAKGDVAFGANGVIDIISPEDKPEITTLDLIKIEGTVSGADNLDNWVVAINGEVPLSSSLVVGVYGDMLRVRCVRGTLIRLR